METANTNNLIVSGDRFPFTLDRNNCDDTRVIVPPLINYRFADTTISIYIYIYRVPSPLSRRFHAMCAPLERNKRPSVLRGEEEKRGSGATTCNKTRGEPTEVMLHA